MGCEMVLMSALRTFCQWSFKWRLLVWSPQVLGRFAGGRMLARILSLLAEHKRREDVYSWGPWLQQQCTCRESRARKSEVWRTRWSEAQTPWAGQLLLRASSSGATSTGRQSGYLAAGEKLLQQFWDKNKCLGKQPETFISFSAKDDSLARTSFF